MSLTIACVLVRGHVPFSVEYVERLHAMCKRTIARPFRFVCLTDQADRMPDGVIPVRTHLPAGLRGWWAKVNLFDPRLFRSGRVIYFDLDVLLLGGIDEIIDYPAPFALASDGSSPDWKPK